MRGRGVKKEIGIKIGDIPVLKVRIQDDKVVTHISGFLRWVSIIASKLGTHVEYIEFISDEELGKEDYKR